MKAHIETNELRITQLILSLGFVSLLTLGLGVMFTGKTLTAIIIIGVASFFGYLALAWLVALQGRFTRELILKVNDKEFKDFCDCRKCKNT